MRFILTCFTFFLFCLQPLSLFAQDNVISTLEQLKDTIVSVSTEYVKIIQDPKTKDKHLVTYTRTGSGVILHPKGLIVTNTHTIINAPQIFVTLSNGQKYSASLISANLDYDFSLIRIETPQPLKAITFASMKDVTLDMPILMIGSSTLNQDSLLSGNISRILTSQSSGQIEFMDVRLRLYKGDSGGPVFNHAGQLLGIVMANHKSDTDTSVIISAKKIQDQYWQWAKNVP